MDRTRAEFPSVKRDLSEQLNEATKMLASMGDSRSTRDEQVGYLLNVKNRFDQLVNYGINAYYTGDPLFSQRQELRLITHIRELNETFAKVFFRCGHHVEFDSGDSGAAANEVILAAETQAPTPEDSQTSSICSSEEEVEMAPMTKTDIHPLYLHRLSFRIPTLDDHDDLDGILQDPACSVLPLSRPFLRDIARMYLKYRGNELGTVSRFSAPRVSQRCKEKPFCPALDTSPIYDPLIGRNW
jgi:hypothetical protein